MTLQNVERELEIPAPSLRPAPMVSDVNQMTVAHIEADTPGDNRAPTRLDFSQQIQFQGVEHSCPFVAGLGRYKWNDRAAKITSSVIRG